MTKVHLDLSRDATRQYIFAELLQRLNEDQRAKLNSALEEAGVPEKHHHNKGEVAETIECLNVSERVKADADAIYVLLAEAEAQVHGCAVEETHFHEVGNGEAIRNVIGICLAIEALDPERITASPVQTGQGTIECSHGTLSIPAPATAALLAQDIPLIEAKFDGELCTPTSAAVIKHFVDEFVK